MTKYIGVYGTLKRGHGNHRLLNNDGFKYVGEFLSVDRFHMTSAGGFPIVYREDPREHIHLEVFEVLNPDYMHAVDRLEGAPQWYQRTPIKVFVEEKGKKDTLDVEIYTQKGPVARPFYTPQIQRTQNAIAEGPVASWVRRHD